VRLLSSRLPYSAIVDRPPLKLPDQGRLVVWTIVNVEEWSIERPMPRTVLSPPLGQPLLPDLPNWAWHEYGMRVGFWRLLEALQRYKVVPTLAINGSVCRTYPRIAQAAREAGWEFMGHGYVQRPMHHLENQKQAIDETIKAIRECTGKAPRGWESPGLSETPETIDLLAEAGIEYVANWPADDQPCRIETAKGHMVGLPYTLEMNDIPMMVAQSHPAEEWLRRGIDQFERLYAESERITRVMALSMHPYISGVAHRIGYIEKLYAHIASRPGVVHWTGERILDWYVAETATQGR
jgi:peptidoglycan/xylan/chitin deacetylase (PgdA/CDA1 family)